jgi:type I restriction enzyme S subunit
VSFPTTNFAKAPFEIIDGDRGKAYPKQDDFQDSGYCLFLSAANVTKSGFDFETGQFVDERKDAQLKKGKLQREDIVLTTRGTLGNVAYYDDRVPFENIRINSGMVILRCEHTKILPSFLYLFLRSDSFKLQVERMRSGVAQPQLPIRDMKHIELPLPTPEQQARMVEATSPYDALIENNRRRIALLEETARMLYREWFIYFRFPSHEHVKTIDGIPEGWDTQTLTALCSPKDGIQTGPFGSQLHQSDYADDGVPVVMPKDIIDYRISTASIARIPEELANRLGRHRMRVGDTIYGRRGDIGRRAYIDKRQNEWFCGTGCLRIRPDPLLVAPRFLYEALGSPATAGFIANQAKGSTMPNLSAGALKDVPILCPPRSLQHAFLEVVESTSDLVENLLEQMTKLAQARDILLPRLMNGEIAV